MNIQQINSAIIHGQWTHAEVNSMVDAIRFARKVLRENTKCELTIGDRVQFRNTRTGAIVMGILKERKIKNAIVEAGPSRWRVPFEMLSKVEV